MSTTDEKAPEAEMDLDLDQIEAAVRKGAIDGSVVLGLVRRMRVMEALSRESVCVYCGDVGPKDVAYMSAHVRSCPKRDDALSADLRAHAEKLQEVKGYFQPVLTAYAALQTFMAEHENRLASDDDEAAEAASELAKNVVVAVGEMVEAMAAPEATSTAEAPTATTAALFAQFDALVQTTIADRGWTRNIVLDGSHLEWGRSDIKLLAEGSHGTMQWFPSSVEGMKEALAALARARPPRARR